MNITLPTHSGLFNIVNNKHNTIYLEIQTCYYIYTDNTLKIVIIIGGVVTLTIIIMIYTISREEEEYIYTHPIPAEDEGKNGMLVVPKRH